MTTIILTDLVLLCVIWRCSRLSQRVDFLNYKVSVLNDAIIVAIQEFRRTAEMLDEQQRTQKEKGDTIIKHMLTEVNAMMRSESQGTVEAVPGETQFNGAVYHGS